MKFQPSWLPIPGGRLGAPDWGSQEGDAKDGLFNHQNGRAVAESILPSGAIGELRSL